METQKATTKPAETNILDTFVAKLKENKEYENRLKAGINIIIY
jgi:hypothetical protein